jgi:hypothetical protein
MSKVFELHIPLPCHENWDEMTPADKGRFCESCQKQVIDFTNMSDSQLVAFFKKPSTGSVCGRFNNTQLNHEFEIPRKRIPWLKYLFTIAIPAFFAATKAKAQGEVIKKLKAPTTVKAFTDKKYSLKIPPVIKCSTKIKTDTTRETIISDTIMGDVRPEIIVGELDIKPIQEEKIITGKIINTRGEPVSFGSVAIKGTSSRAMADMNGYFRITVPQNGNTLIATSVGYESVETILEGNSKELTINITLTMNELSLGEVVVGAPVRRKKIMAIPLIPRVFKDTAFKYFKFFPNPAAAGSVITLEWNKFKGAEFDIQLRNIQGQLMTRMTESLTETPNSISYTLPQVTPGTYLLVLVNRKSGKKVTEKIIIR